MHTHANNSEFKGEAIITLQTRAECEALKHALKKSSFTLFKENLDMIFVNEKSTMSDSSLESIRLEYVPAAHSLRWAYAGISRV